MPKHAFKFPRVVIEAVRAHVNKAIRHVPPEQFWQEASYTAALASQLQGTAYEGEYGSVQIESTVIADRGPHSAEHRFGADFAITASVSDGRRHVRKAILIQAKLGRIEQLNAAERRKLIEQIADMKKLIPAPKVMEIPEHAGERTPSVISGIRVLNGEPYVSMPLPDYFVARVTTTLDGATNASIVAAVRDSRLTRAHLVARLVVE